MPQTWTSAAQAAALLNCDIELITRWAAAGQLPSRRDGAEICLQVDAAPTVNDLAAITVRDSAREPALSLALAKLAQDDAARARRSLRRTQLIVGALVALLFGGAAYTSYTLTHWRDAYFMTIEALMNAQKEKEFLSADRDRLLQESARAQADASAARARADALEEASLLLPPAAPAPSPADPARLAAALE